MKQGETPETESYTMEGLSTVDEDGLNGEVYISSFRTHRELDLNGWCG